MSDAETVLKRLSSAGAKAFIMLESAPDEEPLVICKFRTIDDAWEFYRALIACGNAALGLPVEEER